jgi:cell wall-associated NlpC family hydrolase
MKCNLFLYAVLPALALFACSSNKSTAVAVDNQVGTIVDSVRKSFAPDSRVKIFDVKYARKDNQLTVKGITSSKEAKNALIQKLTDAKMNVKDSLQLLPDADLGAKIYGIVDLSVCNLRCSNDFSAELSLQALLGMPVHILQDKGWYRVQTPDNYIGWVYHTGITAMTKKEYEAWNLATKVVVTSHYGFTYSRPDETSQTVSDVVSGDRLKWESTDGDFYKVSYPNGRVAYISKKISMNEREWRANLKQDAASIIKTAYTLVGIPYMWGANSAKGVDCSGFVRTVLFLHDIIIPRDASQQAYVGQHIDIAPGCSNLEPGDLVFFGHKAENGKKERVVHVALYVGNQRFIQSQGDVHESSFNPQDENYDSYNLGRRLFAVRFLPYLNKEKNINTTLTNPFYN